MSPAGVALAERKFIAAGYNSGCPRPKSVHCIRRDPCTYLAANEEIIHKHANPSGFPATKVTEVRKLIDPIQ